jgi:hypothetical protein
MAISLAQYLAEASQRDRDLAGLECCDSCGVPLQEAIQGYRKVCGKPHCSDCYFSELSDLIDQHPIGRPMASSIS